MLDMKTILVQGGDGGNGCVSFHREKYVPLGGPDGGNGGAGGDVKVIASRHYATLQHLKGRRKFAAGRGSHGSGRNRQGKGGGGIAIDVPVGTLVWALKAQKEKVLLADLAADGEQVVVADGGLGGYGNAAFVTPTSREPLLAEAGEEGGRKELLLELRLIADVGVVGRPNAGKSTLVAAVSRARPQIASYPFTTIQPVLGVVETRRQAFVMVEIPGLVEGAHAGRGLGLEFLRHAERTRVLLHLVDGTNPDILKAYRQVRNEIVRYSTSLASKPEVIAITKADLLDVQQAASLVHLPLGEHQAGSFIISAVTGDQVEAVLGKLLELLEKQPKEVPRLRCQSVDRRVHKACQTVDVRQENEVFVVSCPQAERLVSMADMRNWQVRAQLHWKLKSLGVVQALEQHGVQPGDTVRIGYVELEWE